MKFGNESNDREFIPIPKGSDRMFDMGLSPKQLKVWWNILEATIGYQKGNRARRTDRYLSPKYISKCTGIPETTVRRAYRVLEKKKMIRCNLESIDRLQFPSSS